MEDIREKLFGRIAGDVRRACIYADNDGIISGIGRMKELAEEVGVTISYSLEEGSRVMAGDVVAELKGHPLELVKAEELLIGAMSKTSGVATAADHFIKAAAGRFKIVCGAYKKMPSELKASLRQAVHTGGVCCKIVDGPMIYMDKNYVTLLGDVRSAVNAAKRADSERKVVVQIHNRYGNLLGDAWAAVIEGVDVLFVDTGNMDDVREVCSEVKGRWANNFKKIPVIAYAGGVTIDDVDALAEIGIDAVDIGRSIVDAPLLDMHMTITGTEETETGYNLFEKNELRFENVLLDNVNLTRFAEIVAEGIGVDKEDVLVIDVRYDGVALDVLKRDLDPSKFVSREQQILRNLGELEGVKILPDSYIQSHGMLGWIAGDDEGIEEAQLGLAASDDIAKGIWERLAKTAIVFPSGIEVERGEIEDTNTPTIKRMLEEEGYEVTVGEVLKDDRDLFSGKLRNALDKGYGLMITSGGVGAEDKDHSVEATLLLDPDAATPYIAKFHKGHGRHVKEGIRIGVGQIGNTMIINMPGPNDEVKICTEVLRKCLREKKSKEIIAQDIANALRERLRQKLQHQEQHPGHYEHNHEQHHAHHEEQQGHHEHHHE